MVVCRRHGPWWRLVHFLSVASVPGAQYRGSTSRPPTAYCLLEACASVKGTVTNLLKYYACPVFLQTPRYDRKLLPRAQPSTPSTKLSIRPVLCWHAKHSSMPLRAACWLPECRKCARHCTVWQNMTTCLTMQEPWTMARQVGGTTPPWPWWPAYWLPGCCKCIRRPIPWQHIMPSPCILLD